MMTAENQSPIRVSALLAAGPPHKVLVFTPTTGSLTEGQRATLCLSKRRLIIVAYGKHDCFYKKKTFGSYYGLGSFIRID